jgi:hypothetical protein
MQSVANAKVGIEDIKRKIKESRKFLDEAEKKTKINKKLQFKRDFAVSLTEEIERQLKEHVDTAIKVITASVNKFLSRAAAQEMKFALDKNFRITVLINGLKRPLSEGQQQLVGLVFLGALVDFCKVRKTAQSKLLLPGATAPLILDAPFSKLDDEYMPEVARVLPQMSEQLVMMLSGSQSRPEVTAQFEEFVGKQYIINRHNKGAPGEDAKTWDITIGGKTYERNKFHESQNSSFIEEV